MDADSSKGVKLFATDGTYQYYDFADDFILSYGNTRITDKQSAYDYLNTLKLKSYKRKADMLKRNLVLMSLQARLFGHILQCLRSR